MRFRQLKSVKLPYNKQALIYYTCLDYANQPPDIQSKINNLCLKYGNQYYQALHQLLTTDTTVISVATRFYVSETTLNRARQKFFENWC